MVAILVLVLWLFTAGAGFSVLISSNLKRDRSAPAAPLVAAAAPTPSPAAPSASPRAAKQLRRERFDPPSLVAARNAPLIPGGRALLEFTHPACGIIGLAFWLGFTLVHARLLGWIGFGLAAVTACAGLTWFTVNVRAARRHPQHAPHHDAPDHESAQEEPAPSFHGRLVALHGAAAALTLVLAALTALMLLG
jgi:hypothetical protein